MEEILTGEIDEAEASLTERAAELIHAAGHSPVADPSTGLSAEELASCVLRTLSLPEIKALRPELLAEFPVYTARTVDGKESVTASVADALTLTKEGQPQAVVDWKSDVAADAQTIDHYRAQVQANIDTTGAERGLIVMMGQGSVIHVQPTHLSHA
ncbi:hypothetical protein GCM10011367_24310 [Marinicauda pacifica]|nr:hypothetical protein [Marinicauda pacifica]GGE48624.1 hypothetical protein GCM10011367_24310 [Marinicauda pacifica]